MTQFGLPEHVIEQICTIFSSCHAIRRVILYGSRAKGTHRTGSDIDLCIDADTLTLSDLLALETQIDDLLLPWKIDLSLIHKIDNPDLLAHIKRVGVVFYEP